MANMAPERIQKLLARAGYGSRREIEQWIRDGRVSVNGEVATLGQRLTNKDEVAIDNKPVSFRLVNEQEHQTLIYHKPEGEVCTKKDEEGRPTIFDRLPRVRIGRWINVGRLDINTSGLLILTTDGDLAHRLMHPSSEIEREYAVRVFGLEDQELVKQLTKGVQLDDGFAKFDKVSEAAGTGANKWFHVVLKEGRNREVRRLWEAIDCTVTRLMRVRFGNLSLPKQIRPGRWEYLTEKQLQDLYKSVDLVPPTTTKPKTLTRKKTFAHKKSKYNKPRRTNR